MESSDLLDNDEAAAIIRVAPTTLQIWRSTRRYDIPYVRVGRLIRYRRGDILKWLDSRQVGGEAA